MEFESSVEIKFEIVSLVSFMIFSTQMKQIQKELADKLKNQLMSKVDCVFILSFK